MAAADLTAEPPALTPELVAALPKVVLHDHLDGGLRPATIVELAAEAGHELPTTDPAELGAWFVEAADSGSLERYLTTFDHTIAVMQTPDALRRVARESVLDLAADGVVYAEQRYAPEQHLQQGMSLQEVVDAVQQGFDEGVAEAAEAGRTITVGTLVTAMRHADRGVEIAELALANRDAGVVGFDIAGAEAAFPPSNHLEAFTLLRRSSFPVTIHAGESSGADAIWEALQLCGALRIGHGVRIDEDIELAADGSVDGARLGVLAHWVRDRQVPLEICPSSNLQTAAAESIATHPITMLRDLGFAVTINTDNRLMSGTSMSREISLLAAEAGWTLDDVEAATLTAAFNGFAHHDVLEAIVAEQILPAFAELAG
ncbi:adenosine deaminase [Beutenbergia cavernae DSM 12333]|uniref:adenosine deaminase n=1 Tax=Beutenbergia cavernae (strain ATCC BAA-8 / DSM 12333 / CCUG 43141 / JCM 11478 / NBRC 16432 / NCIMB 13614 / HKI 0122) TaxID=471853 RepID=C5BZ66_BEUC1|nr:adenosine deaminase [Beutenbergia cavernae]ACQ81181.1 adenosine deaminase [Beutenbergia cavernae DSM 12333]